MSGSIPPIPTSAFMAWRLIKPWDRCLDVVLRTVSVIEAVSTAQLMYLFIIPPEQGWPNFLNIEGPHMTKHISDGTKGSLAMGP
jgi:hypothetical protein